MKQSKIQLISCLLFVGLTFGFCNAIGQQKENYTDANGNKQGIWIKKNKKNKIVYKGQFKDNLPIDTFYYYDKKGKVDLVNVFSSNGKITDSKYLYPNGKTKAEGQYIDKKKEGPWIYYNEKGKKIKQTNYKNDQKEGIETIWDNVKDEIIESTTYLKGQKEGKYFQSLYIEGYYITTYHNNKLDGEYTEYNCHKRLKVKGQYQNGDKQGTWQIYDGLDEKEDNIVQRLFYKNDTLLGDAIRFRVKDGIKEIPQNKIAIIAMHGKQVELILFSGEKIDCFNDLDNIIKLTDGSIFTRVNDRIKTYVNIHSLIGINKDNSLQFNIENAPRIIADKDGRQAINSLFRND